MTYGLYGTFEEEDDEEAERTHITCINTCENLTFILCLIICASLIIVFTGLLFYRST